MIRRPPRSTPFPTRRSSDLLIGVRGADARIKPLARVQVVIDPSSAGVLQAPRLRLPHEAEGTANFEVRKIRFDVADAVREMLNVAVRRAAAAGDHAVAPGARAANRLFRSE